jgi:hypothetical protein
VAEAVEDEATVAEKVSSEVAELPENGRLRTAAVLLEHASKEVAEEAHLAQNIIHKVHTPACSVICLLAVKRTQLMLIINK